MKVDELVEQCRAAAGPEEVAGLVGRFLAQEGLDDVLGPRDRATYRVLHEGDDLTLMHLVIPPTPLGAPHEHGMWAVVGVYAGEETNQLYDRTDDGVEPGERFVLGAGDVRVLPEGQVHAVQSVGGYVAAVHVYGGDLMSTPRSTWDAEGHEQSLDESFLPGVFATWNELEAERGRPLKEEEVLASVAGLA